MILKKPYAMLIKHFKLVHIIVVLLTSFIALKSYEILEFFRNYIKNGYTVTITDNLASNYIHPLIYLAIILIIIICIAIYILLRTKKKPNKIYLATIIYYTILFTFILVAAFLINGLQKSLWATADARTYRDFAQLIYYPQFIFIAIMFIRALGFNVKQFNFKSDLKELEITDADSEEVELNINFETYKAERIIRRFIREFKYYFLENKLIFIVIGSVLVLIFGYLIFKNYEKVKYTYKEGDTFAYKQLSINISDSILTNVDQAGNKIYDNKYYLLTKITITNNSLSDKTLDYNNFKLYYGNEYVYPTLDIGSYFIDYGKPYMGDTIRAGDSKTYIIPYIIDEKKINKTFKISIYIGSALKSDDFLAKKITVKLKPSKIGNPEVVRNASIGEIVSFSSTLLKESSLTIKNAEFITRYEYQYQSCFKEECRTYTDVVVADTSYQNKQTLIVMDYDLVLDNTADSYQNINSVSKFADSFMSVEYTLPTGETKKTSIKYVTPTNINDKLILQTDGGILTSSKVDLLITIRNRTYIINLK